MIVLLDCDDVMGQFTERVLEKFNENADTNFTIEDCTSWEKLVDVIKMERDR